MCPSACNPVPRSLLLAKLGEPFYLSYMLITKELLPGTLDMLILKALSLGPNHGYGVLLRIEDTSKSLLALEQGSLYPALNRLEHRGLIDSEWGVSENNRRAKFYRLTIAGRGRLEGELTRWREMVRAVSNVLETVPSEG